MPGYKIIESVGSGIQSVNKWSDIEHHHPSNKLHEDGRVYAKAQNVRPTYIKAYDDALTDVDVLVMPTCLMTAPRNHTPII